MHFHSGRLVSEARRLQTRNQTPGPTEDTRHIIGRQHRSSTPMFHVDDISGELGRNGTGLSDAFKLTKLVWTDIIGLVIVIGR